MAKEKNSIVEIAKRTNVSIATVSRVINRAEGYSEKTKQKVLKAIRESGYSPNLNAVSLRTHKSMCIGVIVPDITNEYFARLIRELDDFFVTQKYAAYLRYERRRKKRTNAIAKFDFEERRCDHLYFGARPYSENKCIFVSVHRIHRPLSEKCGSLSAIG